MDTYAGRLRELADLLDQDFLRNVGKVIDTLEALTRNLHEDVSLRATLAAQRPKTQP